MKNVAVLIDAENVQASFADKIFTYANSIGTIIVKEIYGVSPALGLWVEPVLRYAIHSNLTIKASKFKNTSDISLVIGAMDLLIAGKVDTVIIVSSDSDFSTLSVRLRSAGLEVIGMGTEKANPLWRTACSSFVVLSTGSIQTRTVSKPASTVVVQPAPKPVRPIQSVQHPNKPPVITPVTQSTRTVVIPPVQQVPKVTMEVPVQSVKPTTAQEATIPVTVPQEVKPALVTQSQQTTVPAQAQGTQNVEANEKPRQNNTPVVTIPAEHVDNSPIQDSKPAKPKVALTHSDRAETIRKFITRQLQMNGGRMGIPNLFHALNNLQDYHVDQQGSKRKPLNYLTWMFGDVFVFGDGFVSLPKSEKNEKDETRPAENTESGSVSGQNNVDTTIRTEKDESDTKSDGVTVPDQKPAENEKEPVEKKSQDGRIQETSEQVGALSGNIQTPTLEMKPEIGTVNPVAGSEKEGQIADARDTEPGAIKPAEEPEQVNSETKPTTEGSTQMPEEKPAQTKGSQRPEKKPARTGGSQKPKGKPTKVPELRKHEAKFLKKPDVKPVNMEDVKNRVSESAVVAGSEKSETEPVQAVESMKPGVNLSDVVNERQSEMKPAAEQRKKTIPKQEKNQGKPARNDRYRATEKQKKKPGMPMNKEKKEKTPPEEQESAVRTPAEKGFTPAMQSGNEPKKETSVPQEQGNPSNGNQRVDSHEGNNLRTIQLSSVGIQTKPASILSERGYRTLADVEKVSDKTLLGIKGIGQATVDQIRAAIRKAVQ